MLPAVIDSALSGRTLPLLWYYPRHLPALGHLSHDTDGHNAELGQRLLEVLQRVAASRLSDDARDEV